MNPDSTITISTSALPHCRQRSASGRRCRMPIADPASGLCPKHAAAQKKERDAANLAATLIGDTQEFTSAVAINRSLGELYKLLARDEIAPRRAAVMAYTGSLLLRTLPAIEHELGLDTEETIRVDLGDLPRPDRSQTDRDTGPSVIWDVSGDTDDFRRPELPADSSPNSGNGAPK